MKNLIISIIIVLILVTTASAFTVTVERINKIDSNTLKAFADINIDGVFVVKGLRVINGKNGLFVSMPQELGEDGIWYDTSLPITAEARQQIIDVVLKAYNK